MQIHIIQKKSKCFFYEIEIVRSTSVSIIMSQLQLDQGSIPVPVRVQTPPPSLQDNLDVLMGVLEENQERIPEGEYLRGMNALGSLHRMKNKAEFVEITAAGIRESHVHDVQITKEAPNYRAD